MQSETILHGAKNGLNSANHRINSVPQSVGICTWPRNLINSYIQKKVGICLHFHASVETADFEGRDFAIMLQKSASVDAHANDVSSGRYNPQLGIGFGKPGADKMELTMPVFARPIMQNAKTPVNVVNHLVGREIGSVVRLYRLDNVPTLLREWLDIPTAVIEIGEGVADGESEMLLIGGRVLSAIKNGSFIYDPVKRGTELIKDFAEFEGENCGQTFVAWLDPDSSCPIGVHATVDSIGVFIDKLVPNFNEGLAVSVCAFDSLPTSLEWGW